MGKLGSSAEGTNKWLHWHMNRWFAWNDDYVWPVLCRNLYAPTTCNQVLSPRGSTLVQFHWGKMKKAVGNICISCGLLFIYFAEFFFVFVSCCLTSSYSFFFPHRYEIRRCTPQAVSLSRDSLGSGSWLALWGAGCPGQRQTRRDTARPFHGCTSFVGHLLLRSEGSSPSTILVCMPAYQNVDRMLLPTMLWSKVQPNLEHWCSELSVTAK